jgi:hypothetical protein
MKICHAPRAALLSPLDGHEGCLATLLKWSLVPSPETSRRNLEKAKANWRAPLPWRSVQETRLIKTLAWQWYKMKEPRCGGRQIARWLGVSHTYIQKLVREFDGDARNIVQQQRAYGRATFADLQRAQEETAKIRELGWLRRSAKPPDIEAVVAAVEIQCIAAKLPRVKQIPCDPLVEVKYSMMLAAEENRKVRPVPFFRRRRRHF